MGQLVGTGHQTLYLGINPQASEQWARKIQAASGWVCAYTTSNSLGGAYGQKQKVSRNNINGTLNACNDKHEANYEYRGSIFHLKACITNFTRLLAFVTFNLYASGNALSLHVCSLLIKSQSIASRALFSFFSNPWMYFLLLEFFKFP